MSIPKRFNESLKEFMESLSNPRRCLDNLPSLEKYRELNEELRGELDRELNEEFAKELFGEIKGKCRKLRGARRKLGKEISGDFIRELGGASGEPRYPVDLEILAEGVEILDRKKNMGSSVIDEVDLIDHKVSLVEPKLIRTSSIAYEEETSSDFELKKNGKLRKVLTELDLERQACCRKNMKSEFKFCLLLKMRAHEDVNKCDEFSCLRDHVVCKKNETTKQLEETLKECYMLRSKIGNSSHMLVIDMENISTNGKDEDEDVKKNPILRSRPRLIRS
ncbi:hypothetical protein LR48_Vigan08g098700 [Vigna angularis]|uniref:Uncharacterized protein n=1 Tax=Phaseolus angularis TaxID=3914 RepID=A0A0L9V4Z3_PHAAN|nr:hypothetical protein LR48_Vigan08g098700 [Vigna angularis]